MITRLEGSAVMVVDSRKLLAQPLENLPPKSLLELRGGSKLTVVYFASGIQEEYTGPALVGVGLNRGKVFYGEESARSVVSSGSALIRAVDPAALPEKVDFGPVQVRLKFGTTTFEWETGIPGPYHLTVFLPARGKTPRSVVWSQSTPEKSSDYTGPELNPEVTYVVVVDGAGREKVAANLFRLHEGSVEMFQAARQEADTMAAARPDDPTPHVLLSTLYTQHGRLEEAADAMGRALGAQPDEDAFIERMKDLTKHASEEADKNTAFVRGYYEAREAWGLGPYYDPLVWPWDGWDEPGW